MFMYPSRHDNTPEPEFKIVQPHWPRGKNEENIPR
jgi:hypothetical protein